MLDRVTATLNGLIGDEVETTILVVGAEQAPCVERRALTLLEIGKGARLEHRVGGKVAKSATTPGPFPQPLCWRGTKADSGKCAHRDARAGCAALLVAEVGSLGHSRCGCDVHSAWIFRASHLHSDVWDGMVVEDARTLGNTDTDTDTEAAEELTTATRHIGLRDPRLGPTCHPYV